MSWLDWLILAVAAWRLSALLVEETGPWALLARLRTVPGLRGLLACIKCTSVWVAAILLAGVTLWPPAWWIARGLAVSGAALMLRTYTGVGYDRPAG